MVLSYHRTTLETDSSKPPQYRGTKEMDEDTKRRLEEIDNRLKIIEQYLSKEILQKIKEKMHRLTGKKTDIPIMPPSFYYEK